MSSNVKQIGTFKNFTHILDVRFHNININQIWNRILIILLIIWNLGISLYLVGDKILYNKIVEYPITNLKLIELEE